MSEGLPMDWRVQTVSEVFDFLNGKAFYSDGYSEAGFRVIDLLNITLSGKLQLTKKDKFITIDIYDKYPKSHLRKNDLIIIMTDITPTLGLIGQTALIDKSSAYVLNQRVGCLRPKKISEIDISYMSYLFNSNIVRLQVVNRCLGTAQYYVNTPDIKQLRIYTPPLPEQKKIAKILSSVDEVIETTETQINKLKDLKKGLMNELLTKGIGHTEFKDSPVGRIPVEWEVSSLSSICDLQVGYAFKSSSFSNVGIKLLRGENVGYGKPIWKINKCLPKSVSANYSSYFLKEDDIVIGMDRTFTKTGSKITKISSSDLPCILVQRVGRFIPTKSNNDFLWHLVRSNRYLNILIGNEKGMDIPHLSKSEILTPVIAIPPLQEQQQIASILTSIDTNIEQKQTKLTQSKNLKKSLMADLLTGRVRVTVN